MLKSVSISPVMKAVFQGSIRPGAYLLIVFLAHFALPSTTAAQSDSLRIANFSYFDVYSKTMASGSSLVIEGGKIAALNDESYGCAGCETIDLAGGYIVPGLIDLHQHLGTGGFGATDVNKRVALFRKNLYWGITTAFNPSIPTDVMKSLQMAVRKTPQRFPRFITAGRNIGPEGGWGDFKTATVGGLKAAINAQINAGAAIIKISYDDKVWLSGKALPLFSQDALATAIDYAHQRERRVFVHTTQVPLAKNALRAGADGITAGLIVGDVDNELIALMKNRRAIYMATFSAFAAIENNSESAARQKAFDPDLVNGNSLYTSLSSPIMRQNWRDWYPLSHLVARQLPTLRNNTKRLINAGIRVGLGSDAGTPGVVFGSALADEMQRHVDMGLRPADAIYMATTENARILFLNSVAGSIEVGKEADLVLLSEDPTQSISAFKSIQYTVRGGRLYNRQEF